MTNAYHAIPIEDGFAHDFEDCPCDPDVQWLNPTTGLPLDALLYGHKPFATVPLVEEAERIKEGARDA